MFGVSFLLIGCGPSNEPIDADSLRLLDTTTSPAESVFSHASKSGPQWAWEGDELGTAPSTPLGSTRVTYHSDSDRTEVDLFARDPDELLSTLSHLPLPPTYVFDAWDAQVSQPAASPWVLGIPYPDPHAFVGDDSPQEFQLSTGYFFQGSTPVGPAAAPGGKSSVKAAFLYNHGMCSRVQSMETVVDELGHRLFKDVTGGVQANDPSKCTDAIQHYARITSYVTHRAGDPHDLRGGLLVSAWMEAKFNQCFSYCYPTPIGPICEDKCDGSHTLLTYEFEFGLTGPNGFPNGPGILTVKPKKQYLGVTGDLSWLLSGIVETQIESDTPARVLKRAFDEQRQEVLEPSNTHGACQVGQPHQCIHAAADFANISKLGAAMLGMSPDEQDALGHTITQNDELGNKAHWLCDPRPSAIDAFAGRCEFIVRAKRVNVYPDELELVWFDAPDTSSTAFAAYTATFAAADGTPKHADAIRAREQLCSYDPRKAIDVDTFNSFRQRAFATYSDNYRIAEHTGDFCFRDPGGWW